MRVLKSDLELEKFNILSSMIETIPSKEKIAVSVLTNIPVELDFDILSNKQNKNKVRILLQIGTPLDNVNVKGYRFSLTSEAFFGIKDLKKRGKKEQDQFILFTAIPMVIAMARSHLYNATANFPYGQYLLPSIDLVDLFSKKFPQNNES